MMNAENKTEWIHVRVTKGLKHQILQMNMPISQFVTEAIISKLNDQEAGAPHC